MIELQKIRGLKYPDEYFIKFFFKNGLHEKSNLKYLEFGCGNGSNLMLPYQYQNEVIGIDYDRYSIDNATYNFNPINDKNTKFTFYADDMRKFVQNHNNINAAILSLPNIINYISKNELITFFKNCKSQNLYKKDARFFIRFRTPKDFRFGLGERIDSMSYRVDEENTITGEAGALNCFYTENYMLEILKEYLTLSNYKVFHIDFENIASNGDTILNSDIVIWGIIN